MTEAEEAPIVELTPLDKAIEQVKYLFSQETLAWVFATSMQEEDPEGFEILLEQYEERVK